MGKHTTNSIHLLKRLHRKFRSRRAYGDTDVPIIYRPLDSSKQEIRIIDIAPASDLHQPPVCSLRTVSLEKHPHYGPLSYVWGDPNDTVPIEVEGKPVEVTRNLDAALRFLRSKGITPLWVDAICINQLDLSERASQVSLMYSIYRNATCVHVWLGEFTSNWWNEFTDDAYKTRQFLNDDKGTMSHYLLEELPSGSIPRGAGLCGPEQDAFSVGDAQLDDFRFIHQYLRDTTTQTEWTRIPFYGPIVNENGHTIMTVDNRWYSGVGILLWLLSRPWFTRVWTLQEAVAASGYALIHVGDQTINFDDIITTVGVFSGKPITNVVSQDIHMVALQGLLCCGSSIMLLCSKNLGPILDHIASGFDNSAGLWNGINASRHKETTDPRDRCFSMSEPLRHRLDIEVDYTIEFQELCCRVTKAALMSRPQMPETWLFFAVGTNDSDLPTWATDFQFSRKAYAVDYSKSEDIFDVFAVQTDTDSRFLRTQAARICTIDFAGHSIADGPLIWPPGVEELKRVKEHINECQEACDQYGIEPRSMRFWKTFLCDRNIRLPFNILNSRMDRGPMTEDRLRESDEFLRKILSRQPYDLLLGDDDGDGIGMSVAEKTVQATVKMSKAHGPVAKSVRRWQFFCSKDGNLGSARPGVRLGDEVFMFKGCAFPAVLRKTEERTISGGTVYNLVGECYLDGWMDGKTSGKVKAWEEVVLA